jgi:imidazolonepropionase-like amidohydrolase
VQETSAGNSIVLRPDRLFDGLEVSTDRVVQISGDRIAGVRRTDDDRARAERQVDLAGCTMLPGLIDCHSHLHYNGLRTAEALAGRSIEDAAFDALTNAPRVLRAGFTTVRDVGTIGNVAVALRELVKKGGARGPRILASGRIITATGGPNAGRDVRHDDGRGFCVHADGEAEVLRAVRDQLELGVDNIKLMASGVEVDARVPTGVSVLRAEEMAIAVD